MHPRRLVAVLVTLTLALQLGLAGRGSTCVASPEDGEPVTMTQGGRMRGMDMSRSLHEADAASTQSPAENHETGDGPCDRTQASTICQLFASCAAGILVSDASGVGRGDEVSAVPGVVDTPALVSRTIAPELPPPRL